MSFDDRLAGGEDAWRAGLGRVALAAFEGGDLAAVGPAVAPGIEDRPPIVDGAAQAEEAMAAAAATFADAATVFDAGLAVELYSYLAPRDLLSLSLTNRSFSKDVREKVFLVCSRQLEGGGEPSASDDGVNDNNAPASPAVVISKEHSFASKSELAECLLDRIGMANLRYDPPGFDVPAPATLAETLAQVREALYDPTRWFDCAWHGTFTNDPAEIWKPPKQLGDVVGCRFEEDLARGRSRDCFVDWMLREMGQRQRQRQRGGTISADRDDRLARDWARLIVAQGGVVGREWQWKCDGEERVGFMIYTPAGDPRLEIRLTKKDAGPQATLPPPSLLSTAIPPPSLLSAFGF